ncbi:MAG: DUF2326 domain-containing protein [Oscillospiraceae bacterium]|nr:DUF2326 domain-containing protein [Oscillospiraceae bacterium]
MLTEIYCSSFGEDKKIPFTPGLNVIQGRSGNSIGKSNILKIVDYAFGGGYYAKSNKDVIKHVGEHDICFCHMFEGKSHFFIRSASSPARVSLCEDNSYHAIKEISTEDFCKWLTKMYALQDLRLTFRNIVSLYSRVWNKPNQVVNHPLSNYNNQSVAESITTLIKLFKRYDPIRELHEESLFLKKRSAIRKQAAEYNFINVPTRKEAKAIENELSEINARIETLQTNIAVGSAENADSLDKQYIALIDRRTELFTQRSRINRDSQRCRKNIQQINRMEPASFASLMDFFPEINMERLSEVAGFHESLRVVLLDELQEEEQRLQKRLQEIETAITQNDFDIQSYTKLPTQTDMAVDVMKTLLHKQDRLQAQLEQYHDIVAESSQKKENKQKLEKELETITTEIGQAINERTAQYSQLITTSNRKAPVLHLEPTKYEYGVEDNTGTGKAFTDLLLFDLSILSLTGLPTLIHDSFLFNNIDDSTKKNFLKLYSQFTDKQIFISLDSYLGEGDKEIDSLLFSSTRLYLSDKKKLFGIDWAAEKEESVT